MLGNKLIADLHKFSHDDKLRAVQLLVDDLTREEEFGTDTDAQYEMWLSYASPEATMILNRLLQSEDQEGSRGRDSLKS